MHFKTPVWEVPSHFSQFVGYQNITSRSISEAVGEDKAASHWYWPFLAHRRQAGGFSPLQAVANHWRRRRASKRWSSGVSLTNNAPIRHPSGEIDIGQVFSDYLTQARKAGLRHETPNAACYWVMLSGQTTPDRPDYCPQCPWVGDINDPQSLDKARKVRLALNLAVNKNAIIEGLWKAPGSATPFMHWYYPFQQGLQPGVEDPAL